MLSLTSSSLSVESIERLDESARSMALLFQGHIVPAPCKWTPDAPIAVFFPNMNAAVAFSVCFQMCLAYAQWPTEVKQIRLLVPTARIHKAPSPVLPQSLCRKHPYDV